MDGGGPVPPTSDAHADWEGCIPGLLEKISKLLSRVGTKTTVKWWSLSQSTVATLKSINQFIRRNKRARGLAGHLR